MPLPRRGLIALLILLLALAAAAAWWRFGRALAVPTVTLAEAELPLRVVGPGSVQARVSLTLAARITAGVVAVGADVGDSVRAGQWLVRLDAREPAARRAAVGSQREVQQRTIEAADAAWRRARAELVLARSREARDQDLQRQGFLSAAALETTAAALASAVANEQAAAATLAARRAETATTAQELRAAEAALSYTEIAAPFDALVIRRLAEPGAAVVPGSPLLQLVDPATVWVAVRVDEAALAQVQTGQPARIRLRSGETLGGRVLRIARQSDAATREVEVHVGFDAPPVRFAIDQEAEVRIETGRARGLSVPVSALLRDGDGRPGLLRVQDGRARFVPVTAGASDGERVLVQGALAAGDTIVAPAQGVRDGMRVSAR
jgi:HlyD family secretion protein